MGDNSAMRPYAKVLCSPVRWRTNIRATVLTPALYPVTDPSHSPTVVTAPTVLLCSSRGEGHVEESVALFILA